MDKEKLKSYMIAMEKIDVKDNVLKYDRYLSAHDIDEEATIDTEDLSYREASGEVTDGIDRQIHKNKDVMADIAEVDFSPKETIEPGAVVGIADRYLVVSASTEPFKFEDKDFLGISVHAPIYSELEGKQAGDSIEVNGKSYTIDSVE